MKVALLVPRFVSRGVIELADSIRKGTGLHAVIAFEVPGPLRNRLSEFAKDLRLRPRDPREVALKRYRPAEQPRSPGTGESAIKYAKAAAIPSWLVPAMNDERMVNAVRESACSTIVSVGAGIVGPALLDLPETVFINAHPGRLPELPGRDTAEWAVYMNQPVHGTVHRMARHVDVGDLLVVEPLDLGRPTTVLDLHGAAWAAAWNLATKALSGLAEGRLSFTPQDPRRRTHMCYRMHPELLRVVSRRLSDGSFFDTQERCLEDFRRTSSH